MEQVMHEIPDAKKLLRPHDPAANAHVIKAFKATYGNTITQKLNHKRCNDQSGLKEAYVKRAKAGLLMPTPAQLLRVVRRKDLEFDPENPAENKQNREWFLWYWDCLLVKVAGSAKWGYSKKNCGCISEHHPPINRKRST